MEGQYSRGHDDYSGIVPCIKWETLGNLVHLEISEIGFSFEKMFNFLSSLNRKLRYLCIRSIHYEVHIVGRNMAQWEYNQFMSFMEKNSGFPELRYFRFEDREHWDSYARVIQYCCEKSPKLEEIHYATYCQNSAKSIETILSRLGWFTTYLGNVLFSQLNLDTVSIITDSHFNAASIWNF